MITQRSIMFTALVCTQAENQIEVVYEYNIQTLQNIRDKCRAFTDIYEHNSSGSISVPSMAL